jgi:hypothetical protein
MAIEREEFKFPDEKETAHNAQTASENKETIDFEVEGDVDVEIVDDTPERDRGVSVAQDVEEVTEEELESYGDKVRRRIKEISHLRHDERRAKEAAIREREELEQLTRNLIDENKRLKTYVSTGEQVYAGTLKSAAEAEYEVAKRRFKEAHEAFDADAIIEAQAALTNAQLKMEKANNFRPTPLQEADSNVETQQTVQSQPKPDEKTLRWQARNQWFGADDEMTAVAIVRHKQLVSSGIDPRSDEYYAKIDSHMKMRFPDVFTQGNQDDSSEKEPVVKKSTTVVAPTKRSTGTKKIILSKSQVELAKRLQVPLERYAEYAKRLAEQENR